MTQLETETTFASAADLAASSKELTAELARLSAKFNDEKSSGSRTYRLFLGTYPKITK